MEDLKTINTLIVQDHYDIIFMESQISCHQNSFTCGTMRGTGSRS